MRLMIACRAIDDMAGGVERQAIALANEMARRGHDVRLFTLDSADAQAFYEIDDAVGWVKLNMGDPAHKAHLSLRLQRMAKTRCIMQDFKPDAVLAFQQGMFLTLRLYTLGMNIPVIAAERESPFRYDFIKEGERRNLIFQTFRLAPHMTVQCESYPEAYPAYLRPKITVIPNAIKSAARFAAPGGVDVQEKILLCVGRLGYQKNQLALLEAFAKIADAFAEWRLVLAGEGEGRADIEAKIEALGLARRVELLGAVKDVSSLYARAHALCIPSRWEGFPNVLGEALAHGLPAVGYQGCGGVRDLIVHGENGVLAEGNGDAQSLSAALKQMLQDDKARTAMGEAAIASMRPFAPDKIYDLWEHFLSEVAAR